MNVARAMIVPLAIALSAGACASTGARSNPGASQLQNGQTTVQVTNNNWATVAVYLVRTGTRVRIGTVTSMSSEKLRVPRTLLPSAGAVRLQVAPIGSQQSYLTPAIQVVPGQQIEFHIENHLPISTVSVRHR